MTNDEKYEYWLDIAEYDLNTAQAMCDTGRWLYVVFMCQQAIEKLTKGLYTIYVDDNIPRIHNIVAIYTKFSDKLSKETSEDTLELFALLSSHYFEARYPEYRIKLSSIVDEFESKRLLEKTKEVFAWLKEMKF